MKFSKRIRIKNSTRIGIVFLLVGIATLVYAAWFQTEILTVTGLGLTFWGALFFLITPVRYVEGSLLESTIVSVYSTIDRLITSLKYQGYGYYIPPYPTGVYIPDHLKGLQGMLVFIPAENKATKPSIEEMARGNFLVKNPNGVLVTPPGSGLLTKIEQSYKLDFSRLGPTEVCEVLPRFILDRLNLARDMEITPNDHQFNIKIVDSFYTKLYSRDASLKSIRIFGCPIISAVACALAKSTGKFVTVQDVQVNESGEILARCQIVQGETE